ncbi:MAG: hypothetical protein AAB551_03350 [Patescibacteria group bacterium]
MSDASLQIDLQSLLQASPALHVLAPEEFQKLTESVEKLPRTQQEKIVKILTDEQSELRNIKAEYDQKRSELFQKYLEDIKVEEKKMIRAFQEGMEKSQREDEGKMLDQLLQKMDEL